MDQSQQYYKSDLQKVSLTELRYYLPGPAALLLWLSKNLKRLPLTPMYTALPIRAASVFVPAERLSARSRVMVDPAIRAFMDLEFGMPSFEIDRSIDLNVIDAGGCHRFIARATTSHQ